MYHSEAQSFFNSSRAFSSGREWPGGAERASSDSHGPVPKPPAACARSEIPSSCPQVPGDPWLQVVGRDCNIRTETHATPMREAQRRISRYSQRADQFDKAAVRKHAAHVAAWIAYGPKGWLPDINELQLLKKFIDRMRGGLLPSRLMEVLPETLAALQRAVATWQASEIWKQAEQELQKSLLKFRCCRRPADDAASGAAVAQDVVAVSDVECTHSGGFQLDGGEVIQVDSGDEADQSSAQASSQHLQLVSKMNEWGFLDSAQRLERLRQAEEAARCPLRRLSSPAAPFSLFLGSRVPVKVNNPFL